MEFKQPYVPLLPNEVLKYKIENVQAFLTSEQKQSVKFIGILAITTSRILFLNQNYSKAFQFLYCHCTSHGYMGKKYICSVSTVSGDDTDEENEEQEIIKKLLKPSFQCGSRPMQLKGEYDIIFDLSLNPNVNIKIVNQAFEYCASGTINPTPSKNIMTIEKQKPTIDKDLFDSDSDGDGGNNENNQIIYKYKEKVTNTNMDIE